MSDHAHLGDEYMVWVRRLLIALPFIIAAALTVLLNTVDRIHRQRITGYGFLFGIPWAWLLDRGWFENIHSRWAEVLMTLSSCGFVTLLYAGCLWLLFRGFV